MSKNTVMHSLYLLIILALVALIFWPGNISEPDKLTPATSEPGSETERSITDAASARRNTQDAHPDDSTQTDELLQIIAERDATIADLEARIADLETAPDTAPEANEQPPQQAAALSEDEYYEMANTYSEQQEAQRDQAFADAQPTSSSDDAQRKIETSFYSLDDMPGFEDLNIECREIYCDVEVTFEDDDTAREFLSYYSSRVFDHAELRTTMMRSESRGNLVVIKADLEPPVEE